MIRADENVQDMVYGLLGFIVKVDGVVSANRKVQTSQSLAGVPVRFLAYSLEKIHDNIENIIVIFRLIEIEDFSHLEPYFVRLVLVFLELGFCQELEFMGHHLLVQFFIKRRCEIQIELAGREDAVVLGTRPPFPGKFVCVCPLQSDVQRCQSLLAVDYGKKVTMPLIVEIRVVLFESLAIPLEKLIEAKALFDVRIPEFPEH